MSEKSRTGCGHSIDSSRRNCLIRMGMALASAAALPMLPAMRSFAQDDSSSESSAELLFATNRGSKIHYTVEGSGPLIVLQHGFFGRASRWKDLGYVDLLSSSFTVASVDSLGHGFSDKPTEPEKYHQAQRAGDIIAVVDALGQEKAHVLGYSMGGWLSVGVAKYYPERVASLMIGGWDCIGGMGTALRAAGVGRMDFDTFFASTRETAPAFITDWVDDEAAAALAPCWDALYYMDGSEQAVVDLDAPVLLWDGRDDPYHDPMQEFARNRGFEFVSTPGDHVQAMLNGAVDAMPEIMSFLARV